MTSLRMSLRVVNLFISSVRLLCFAENNETSHKSESQLDMNNELPHSVIAASYGLSMLC